MTRIVLILPLALLAACEADETPAPAPEPVGEEAAAPTLDISGNWRVTSYRGGAVPGSTAMRASIDGSQVAITSPCARMVWDYEIDGNIVSFTPASGLSGGCAANPTTFENGVADVMAQANIAMDMGGTLNISGPGGAIELQPQ